jgi:hypothetical protein
VHFTQLYKNEVIDLRGKMSSETLAIIINQNVNAMKKTKLIAMIVLAGLLLSSSLKAQTQQMIKWPFNSINLHIL